MYSRDFSFEPSNHLMIVNCPRLPPLQFSQQFWVEDHTHAKDVMRRFICKAFYKGGAKSQEALVLFTANSHGILPATHPLN